MAEMIYRGSWWLVDREENVQQGALKVLDDGRAVLELVGGFPIMKPGEMQPNGMIPQVDIESYPIILGDCGGQFFTLINGSTKSARGGWFEPSSTTNHIITSNYWIEGVHLASAAGEAFVGVELQFDYLLEWMGTSTLSGTHSWTDGQPRQRFSTAKSEPAESIKAEWFDLSFTLDIAYSYFDFGFDDANTRTMSSRETGVLTVRSSEPRSLRQWDEIAGRFRDLLTISMDYPCAIRSQKLIPLGNDANPSPPVHVRSQRVYMPDTRPRRDLRNSKFFTSTDVAFDKLIPLWFDLYTKIDVAVGMLCGLHYASAPYLGMDLMTVSSAAESLHIGAFDHKAMSDEDFCKFKKQAFAGVEKMYRAELQIHNTLSYRKRLGELVALVDEQAMTALVGDIPKWNKLLTIARNGLAHGTGRDEQISLDLQFWLTRVTRAFLSLVIGAQVGVPAEAQRNFINSGQEVTYACAKFKPMLRDFRFPRR